MKNSTEQFEEKKGITKADISFRWRRLIAFVFLIVALIAIISYNPEDLDYFAGGIASYGYPKNWLGRIGLCVGWFFLALFGLGSVIMIIVAFLCCLRRMFWRNNLRKSSWEYYLAIFGIGLGWSMIFGLAPRALSCLAGHFNLSGFPGGLIGNLLCSGDGGYLYMLLSGVGSTIVATLIIIVSNLVIWEYDWKYDFTSWRENRFSRQSNNDNSPVIKTEQYQVPVPETGARRNNRKAVPPVNEQPNFEFAAEEQVPEDYNHTQGDYGSQASEMFTEEPDISEEPVNDEPIIPMPAPRRSNYSDSITFEPTAPVNEQIPAEPVKNTPVIPSPVKKQVPFNGELNQADYALPNFGCLNPTQSEGEKDYSEFEQKKQALQSVFDTSNIDAEVEDYIVGPQVSLFRVAVPQNLNLRLIAGKQENFTMAVRSTSMVRLLLPILGTNMIGIEIPNKHREIVSASELFNSDAWRNNKMQIPIMLGKNIEGEAVMMDLNKAPHALIGGATGSGKSICMFMLLSSILYKFTPEQLRLIIVDPKRVDYGPYEKLPHLLCPLIRESDKVCIPLKWAICEMNRRLDIIARARCRDILEYNSKPQSHSGILDEFGNPIPETMPFIVIVIDEFSDLMCSNRKKDIEQAIQILGQKSRAAGIHMVLATQRPDVKMVTGNIKANIPIRIAFKTASLIDSRTILDEVGAENLTGKGDMLYKNSEGNIIRMQGGWIDNQEVQNIADACSIQMTQEFDPTIMAALAAANGEEGGEIENGNGDNGADNAWSAMTSSGSGGTKRRLNAEEQLLHDAMVEILKKRQPTTSYVQRALNIGYNKAAKIMDELERMGYVSEELAGSRGRREIMKFHPPFEDDVYGGEENDNYLDDDLDASSQIDDSADNEEIVDDNGNF